MWISFAPSLDSNFMYKFLYAFSFTWAIALFPFIFDSLYLSSNLCLSTRAPSRQKKLKLSVPSLFHGDFILHLLTKPPGFPVGCISSRCPTSHTERFLFRVSEDASKGVPHPIGVVMYSSCEVTLSSTLDLKFSTTSPFRFICKYSEAT